MTTIYVVTYGEYSDYEIIALRSIKSEAEEIVSTVGRRARIEEYTLDAPSDLIVLERCKRGLLTWWVVMQRDGDSRVEELSIGYKSMELNSSLALEIARSVPLGYVLVGHVWATSKEHAVKIVNERRTQLIAANE